MGLLEMIREFNELLDEKDGLKEATKRNNEAISAKTKEIAEQMIDDDVPSISVGGYKFFLQNKTMYSKKSEEALILPLDDAAAVEASNSIVNAATEAVYEAVELVALANKAMQDLYRNSSRESTPLEDYMEEQENDGFEEAENASESEDEDAE